MKTHKNRFTLFALIASTLLPQAANAYALLDNAALNDTGRWDAKSVNGRGLQDGLQWNFEANLLGSLKFAEQGVTQDKLINAMTGAFDLWQTAAKNDKKVYDFTFSRGGNAVEAYPSDGSGVGDGKVLQGTEISIFARPANATIVRKPNQPEDIFRIDPKGNREIERAAVTTWSQKPLSTATGKAHNVGVTFVDADVYINSGETWTLDTANNPNAKDFVALLIHEIGHVLGLGHPTEELFFDTNNDPNDLMSILAAAPETTPGLAQKPNPAAKDFNPLSAMIPDAHVHALANDDLSGLRYLYPVPEPSSLALVTVGLFGMVLTTRRILRVQAI